MRSNTTALWIFAIINTTGLIALASIYFLTMDRIVYVDSTKLIHGYKGTEAARKSFEEKTSVLRANVDTLESELRNEVMKFNDDGDKLSDSQRKQRDQSIRTKEQRFYEYRQSVQTQMQQQEAEMTRSVLSEINVYIKNFGETNGYTIIMAATDYGNIAFANSDLDITEKVLAGLNSQYVGR